MAKSVAFDKANFDKDYQMVRRLVVRGKIPVTAARAWVLEYGKKATTTECHKSLRRWGNYHKDPILEIFKHNEELIRIEGGGGKDDDEE